MRIQTFEPLPPQTTLIGTPNLVAFSAVAEVKIDAGACMTLEAWAEGYKREDAFHGVVMNYCDVDGTQQYLDYVIYGAPTAPQANHSQKRVGWVHIGFTHPTLLGLMRAPNEPNVLI